MKPEQVIIEMERAAGWLKVSGHMDENRKTAFDIATRATKKQMRKKPKYGKDNWTEKPRCAVCNTHIKPGYRVNYCHYCGQKIDWEESNE